MTVSSTNRKNLYNGDGSTTTFPYTFKILSSSDVLVLLKNVALSTLQTMVLTTDYTVTNVGVDTGGNIVFSTAPASGFTVIFLRNIQPLQQIHYPEFDTFPSVSHETALDKLTMLAQQQQELIDRSVSFDPTVSGFNFQLPSPQALKFLAIDANAQNFVYSLSSDIINNTAPWTPSITPLTGSLTSITYSQRTGQYTQISNIIWWKCNITLSAYNAGSNTSQLTITGLPIIPVGTGSDVYTGSAQVANVTYSGNSIKATMNGGNSLIQLVSSTSASSSSIVTVDHLSSSTAIYANGFYFTS